ncbi:MAG: hypothetical protein NZM40_01515 [Sphingomonadaceae bacterium]|uniref:hypothetical protein n=1 Tax=Thermaurantiacus sp. TaxID=2820283 RepID=UPI00298F3D0B|nr:hypothetical protein [Thermaurantiacus sp.]MCS6986121.1 hypothetical protein [Sphingomonadaceae bacterium]MDW8414663.1 hypothetical protein [Thermaurantiacus sp.]
MDLSGHRRFLAGHTPAPDPGPPDPIPHALALAAWAALEAPDVEAVDLHLASGHVVRGAVRLRLVGPLLQASTRRQGWTHLFPARDLALVRLVGRGGRRD